MQRKPIWFVFLILGFVSSGSRIEPVAASSLFSFTQRGGQESSDQAERNTYKTLSVAVIDPTGAVISPSHLEVVDQELQSVEWKAADAGGKAEFLLRSGATYKLAVTATGFVKYVETFKLESDTSKIVTLAVSSWCCGVRVMSQEEIPTEHMPVTAYIPGQPLLSLPLPARPVRRARRQF